MFKEILIFMLCLQFSIAKNECKKNASEFIAHKNNLKYEYEKICILSNYQYEEIREHPAKYSESPSQTKVNIEIFDFQIITIKEDSFTMSMNFKVDWIDQRLQPVYFYVTKFTKWAYDLKESEQDRIWMPSIGYRTELISIDQKTNHVSARRNNVSFTSGARIAKGSFVTAEVVCELDFQKYPFDDHLCSIEVRILPI